MNVKDKGCGDDKHCVWGSGKLFSQGAGWNSAGQTGIWNYGVPFNQVLPNCPIIPDDVSMYNKICCPNLLSLKGKTVREKSITVMTD